MARPRPPRPPRCRPSPTGGPAPPPSPGRCRLRAPRGSSSNPPSIGGRGRLYHPSMQLRVVFAEDNFLVREGTAALLATAEGVELIAAVSDLQSLLDAVEAEKPDAVLTDIRMPPTNTTEGIDAARRIRSEHPETGVVVLSQFAEDEYAYELLKDGAEGLGYLLKERVANLDELVRALEEVSRGGSVLDPKVVEAIGARRGSGHGRAPNGPRAPRRWPPAARTSPSGPSRTTSFRRRTHARRRSLRTRWRPSPTRGGPVLPPPPRISPRSAGLRGC